MVGEGDVVEGEEGEEFGGGVRLFPVHLRSSHPLEG